MKIQKSGFRIQQGASGCRPGDLTRRNCARSVTGPTATNLRSARPAGRWGFTLIEVLASMAVLVILVLALTRMFVESSDITQRGTTTLMRNSTAETVMETILKDTESMVVNERLPCYIQANAVDPAGFGFDDVYFVTTSGDQDDDRAYQLRRYYVQERAVGSLPALPRRLDSGRGG